LFFCAPVLPHIARTNEGQHRWVANSHSNGNRGLKQTAAMLAPSVAIK